MNKIAPSILSADFSQLANDVLKIQEGGAQLIHVDIMDGHFVPNISYGPVVMKSLIGKTTIPFDVHLMIEDADKYIEEFVTDNTEYITVHQEACRHLDRTINYIKSFGVKAGVALNPATSVTTIEDILPYIDMVLIMSVNPGFGGQKFIEYTLDKVKKLDNIRKERGLDFKIQIDGGITLDNVQKVKKAGVDIFVAGSSVFKADDITKRVIEFNKILNE